jgi:PTS system mannose-specific IIB component/fructoselysine and glucoselysine-specific PTS system IIB component
MTLSLCRIDDRLIHGQVVIGWGTPLGAQLIVLVDDAVRANQWEQEIYRMALPQDVAVEFVSRDEALARLREWDADPRRVMLVTGDVETMAALVTRGEGVIRRVNLGGIHAGPGRHPCLRYVYLSDDETSTLRRLEAAGAVITAQDVPTTTPVPLHQLRR